MSDTESYALMTPPFWLMNARPSDANRTAVGLSRPDQIVYSRKCGSANVPAAIAAGTGRTAAGGPATTNEAAMTAARIERRTCRIRRPCARAVLVPPCPSMDGEEYPCNARDAMGSHDFGTERRR